MSGTAYDPTLSTLGIPDGLAGWDVLQGQTAANYPALTSDPVVTREIAYFEANAPKATTAAALMADPRLQNFALTAYGLTSESGMTALMTKVLNSDPTSTTSFAAQMSNAQFTQIATAFNYGGAPATPTAATPSSAEVDISNLYQSSDFGTFSGTFGGVTLSNLNLTGATTWQGLAASLQSAFQRADGNRSDISVTLKGSNLMFSDAAARGTATAFAWTANPANTGNGTTTDPTASDPVNLVAGVTAAAAAAGASPATASSGEVTVAGLAQGSTFGLFSGTVGGVSVSNIDLSGDTTEQQISSSLQTAFRSADGGGDNISVTLDGSNLRFSDSAGRGAPSGLTWGVNAANTGTNPQVSNPGDVVAGATATPAPGTPATASAAEVNIGNLSSATSFGQFSGTFGGVSVSKVDLTGDTLQGVASTLQSALRSADGNSKNISVTLNGLNLEFRDAAGRGTASNFAWTAATAAAPATSVVPAPDNLINGSLATPAAGAAATASTAVVSVNNLGQGNNFSSFSGTFGGVSISNVDLTGAATLQTVAANLQAALRSADGNSKNISVSASGANLTFADAAGRGTLTGPAWTMNPANTQPTTGTTDPIVSTVSLTAGAKATPAAGAKAVASSAQVEVDGLVPGNNFSSFSGSFGGVSVNNVDLTAAASWQSLASTLQSALRSADGNSTNISVTANGANIEFSDAAGRGTATGFTWTTNSANAQGEPNVSNPTNLVTGSKATPASAAASGPAVAQPSFIKTVVQKYLESQFETVIGNTSNALEEARYAQQNLPSITNWYSVIASPPLAAVVQTVLGLPSSFGAVDVDVQAQTLAQRMNIKDFQNPAKLATMLNQFVAMSSETAQVSPTSAALQILSPTPSASGIINLTLPTGDSFSSASMSALLLG